MGWGAQGVPPPPAVDQGRWKGPGRGGGGRAGTRRSAAASQLQGTAAAVPAGSAAARRQTALGHRGVAGCDGRRDTGRRVRRSVEEQQPRGEGGVGRGSVAHRVASVRRRTDCVQAR